MDEGKKLYNKKSGKRILLAGFDGDRTLVSYEGGKLGSSWEFVGHTYYSVDYWQGIARKFHDAIEQETDKDKKDNIFMDWVQAGLNDLKGKDPQRVYEQTIPYTKGVEQYIRKIHSSQANVRLAIVSAGLGIIFDKISEDLGFDYCVTNRLGIDGNGMFDGTIDINVTLHDKKENLDTLLEKVGGVDLANVMFVGDDYNDVECLQAVKDAGGLALAINPLPGVVDIVSQAANAVIQDFTELEMYTEIR
ncbi:HAD-IB family phosphatase [Candidatus Woesearchaeota archaeon]|nr:HAD-IB family phosphatase [Candidatus Woesearchaeota archaeon]